MSITRGSIIAWVVVHIIFIVAEQQYYAQDMPGYTPEVRDRRLCEFDPPPEWCFVPEIMAGTQYQEFDEFARSVDNPGDLTGLVGSGWGVWQMVNRLMFFDYDILDARGPLGLIGQAMQWIAAATVAAALLMFVMNFLTRGR